MTTGQIEHGVVYASPDGDLTCDIYRPPGDAHGVAVLLHGGGWRSGSPAALADAADLLAARGWCSVAAQYRLLPQATWPEPLHDVKRVVRWIRASRDRFGSALGPVVFVGFSAGAHLALLAAGTAASRQFPIPGVDPSDDERVDAVVAFYPPAYVDSGQAASLGLDGDAAIEASPIRYVSDRFPPALLLHGTGDLMVPCSQSLDLFEALRRNAVPADLRLYADQPHGFQRLPGMPESVFDDVAAFLGRHLLYREEFGAAVAESQQRWRGLVQSRTEG